MSGAEDAVPPELVAGKYRLTRLLGRGGMGSVWEGVHTSLGTRVAVKFIEAEYADSAEAKSRFKNEARAAATLRSKHVVQVYDHGMMDDGRPYIVMEFLAGEPLDRRLDRVGRLAPAEAAVIVGQVCRALAKAHEAGIVHRDLKPENVFLVWDDEDQADIVKVVDFGIAKFTDSAVGASSATRTGSLLGTPFYMSPEQARGLKSVDYRSDLWSVGVIAYRCIVGDLPFQGEAVGDLLVKICTAPLPVPSAVVPGVPPSFDAWFQRALAREPADRFSSAAELSDALAFACGVQVRGPMPSSVAASSLPAMSAAGVPALTPGAGAYGTPHPGALTGPPTTQTPLGTRSSSRGAVIAAAVVGGVVVLGAAGLLIAKLVGSSAAAPDRAAAASVAVVPAAAASARAPDPVVAPAASAPAPPASAAPAESAEPAPTRQPKPATHVAKPAVKPSPAPAPAPKPAVKPSSKPIDVGY